MPLRALPAITTAFACVMELIMPYAPTVAMPANTMNQLFAIAASEPSMSTWHTVPVTMKNRKLFVSNQLRRRMRETSSVSA